MKQVFVALVWLIRRSKTGLFALLLGVFAFETLQPIAIASFGDLSRLQSILELVPAPFLSLLNVTPEFLGFAGLSGYLSIGFTHPVYHLLTGATVIWFAGRSLAGEMERGSIQISLARPMSRGQTYAARALGVVVVTVVAAAIGPIGTVAGVAIGNPDGSVIYRHLLVQGVASALLIGAIGGATLLISASANTMGQAMGWAIGLLVISYVIDYFAELWSTIKPLEPVSIFNYYDPPVALTAGEISVENAAVLLAVALIGAGAGLLVFARRDLPA